MGRKPKDPAAAAAAPATTETNPPATADAPVPAAVGVDAGLPTAPPSAAQISHDAQGTDKPRPQALSLGRDVHYVRHDGEHVAAKVTKVVNATCANLTLFTDGDGVQRVANVCLGDVHHVGTWHWPERVD